MKIASARPMMSQKFARFVLANLHTFQIVSLLLGIDQMAVRTNEQPLLTWESVILKYSEMLAHDWKLWVNQSFNTFNAFRWPWKHIIKKYAIFHHIRIRVYAQMRFSDCSSQFCNQFKTYDYCSLGGSIALNFAIFAPNTSNIIS